MPSCIYLLTNTLDGKQYIGFTIQTLDKRCSDHLKSVRYNSKTYLHNAIRKYGWDKFTSEIIYQSDDHIHCLKVAEVSLIADYNTFKGPGYNLTAGGEGTLGYNHTEESKQKMSAAKKGEKSHMFGIPKSKETKQKMSEARKGWSPSKETRQKMSDNHHRKGIKYTTEEKIQLSELCSIFKMPTYNQLLDLMSIFTAEEIAKLYGCKYGTVNRWKRKLNLNH